MENIGKKNYISPKAEKIEFRGEDVSGEQGDGMKNFNTLS